MPQLVDLWCLTSNDTLRDLYDTAECCAIADGVLSSDGLDLDENDARVVWAAVVDAITKITQPCLQCW